ncbi:T9SS type A sorting domain-containing protein [Wenyingzhuangia sp. IMCC45533]
MKKYLHMYFIYVVMLFGLTTTHAQTNGEMTFGEVTNAFVKSINPSVQASASEFLNGFDLSAVSSGPIYSALAINENGAGTNAIGSTDDAVLGWFGNGNYSVSSGSLKTQNLSGVEISSFNFAYEQAVGNTIVNFTFIGKKDDSEVGTLVLNSPLHNTAINVNFNAPTTGSFINVDELIILPSNPIFGGFTIDNLTTAEASTLSSNSILSERYFSVNISNRNSLVIESKVDVESIIVFDVTGNEVLRKNNTKTIDISFLDPGIYLTKIILINGATKRSKFYKR